MPEESDKNQLQVSLQEDEEDMINYYKDEQGHYQVDRRKADRVVFRIKNLEDNQLDLQHAQSVMKDQLDINTAITKKINNDIEEVLRLLHGTRTVIKFIVGLTKFGRWILGTVLTAYGLYLLAKGKVTPTDIHLDPFQ